MILTISCWLAPSLAHAGPEPEPEPPAEPARIEGGFSLDRGAWISTPKIGELGIGLLTVMQYRATFVDHEADELGFYLPFIRPNLHASLFEGKLRVFVQPELAGPGVTLLDAQVIYQPHPAFGLDIGQMRPHFSRAWINPIPTLAMPGRGMVDDEFRMGRELGVTAFGRPFAGRFEYDLGLYDAGGSNLKGPIELEPMVVARLAVNPLGAVPIGQTPAFLGVTKPVFGIGVDMWSDRYQPPPDGDPEDPMTSTPPPRQRVIAGGDFVFMSPRVHVLVEGFGRWQVRPNHQLLDVGWGSQGQIGVMVLDNTLELQARAAVMDAGVGAPLRGTWEGGLSWYLWGNHLRAQIHYSCTQNLTRALGCTGQFVQLQSQLWF